MLTLNILCSRLKAILCAGWKDSLRREVERKHQIQTSSTASTLIFPIQPLALHQCPGVTAGLLQLLSPSAQEPLTSAVLAQCFESLPSGTIP